MEKILKYTRIVTALIFIWVGFVGAISFMEAWLKFQADGITLPLGLSIGKLVFSALNKVELTLAILAFIGIMLSPKEYRRRLFSFTYIIPVLILIVQVSWLSPALIARADLIISNQPVHETKIHFLYIALEFIKIISLITYGIKLSSLKFKTK